MSKGELKTLANQKNLLADLTLFAEREQEAFSDVEIITLKQHLRDLASEQACREMDASLINCLTTVIARVDDLVQTEYTSAKEFIVITQDSIQIGVNKSIIDDNAIDYALSLLLQIETFNPGDKHEFGKRVKPCL